MACLAPFRPDGVLCGGPIGRTVTPPQASTGNCTGASRECPGPEVNRTAIRPPNNAILFSRLVRSGGLPYPARTRAEVGKINVRLPLVPDQRTELVVYRYRRRC